MLKCRTAPLMVLGMAGLVAEFAAPAAIVHAEEAVRATRAEPPDDTRWQAEAPSRVECLSGEIKITAPVVGVIGEVVVKPNDKVFAGEPLIRLHDNEIQARLAATEAQIAVRKRTRNDQNPSSRASDRRKAEDAVADAEK